MENSSDSFIIILLLMVAGIPSVMMLDILDYRLITKDRPNVGIVGVYTEERGWGLICTSAWRFELASAVCEYLNFPGTSRYLNAEDLDEYDEEGNEWLNSVTASVSTYYRECVIDIMDMRCNVYPSDLCDAERIAAVTCKEPGYLGCFKDPDDTILEVNRDHALSDGPYYHNQLTIDKCVEYCRVKGFFYAGVEYHIECFCGREDEDYRRHGNVSDKDCYYPSYPCRGDPLKSCVAPDKIAVYLADRDLCDDPGVPANGFMFNNSLLYGVGSKVYFQCSDDFALEGPDVIECVKTYVTGAIVTRDSISNQHNVMWNNSLPNCKVNGFSATTTQTGAIINPVTSFGPRDPTKQEGVLATIITIAILVTLFVIAVVVFIVWRRKKEVRC